MRLAILSRMTGQRAGKGGRGFDNPQGLFRRRCVGGAACPCKQNKNYKLNKHAGKEDTHGPCRRPGRMQSLQTKHSITCLAIHRPKDVSLPSHGTQRQGRLPPASPLRHHSSGGRLGTLARATVLDPFSTKMHHPRKRSPYNLFFVRVRSTERGISNEHRRGMRPRDPGAHPLLLSGAAGTLVPRQCLPEHHLSCGLTHTTMVCLGGGGAFTMSVSTVPAACGASHCQ